jgi:anti-repressor protein
MTDLIKITEKDGKKLVSARELHQILQVKTNFRDWANRKISENAFFEENEDFTRVLNFERAGQSALEFALNIDMAKKLAMSENNEMGNNVRNYFIECEKELKQQFEIPKTYSSALMLAAKQAEQIELQKEEIKQLEPKAEFYDAVTGSNDTIDIGKVAKVLNMGIGRNKLFEFLRESKILQNNNMPYQNMIDRGYFRVIESKYNKSDGSTHISLKTVVYQKGIDYIKNKYNSDKN